MTNVESMDYTHSHPSILASLSGIVHCPFSHWELAQTSPMHPNPVIWYALSHINLLISSSKQPPYSYLSWHFHSHSEMYCHATFHRYIYYDMHHHCHTALHDHVVDIVFVPPCLIFHTCHSWFIIIPVNHRRHSHRVIFCSKYRVVILEL